MRKFTRFCLIVALAAVAPKVRPVEAPGKDFWQQPELDAPIDVAHFNRGLMAEAIFDETNGVRQKLGLKPLKKLSKLNEAADLEAAVGKVYQPPSHTNPFPMIGTPALRVKYAGLDASRVAENIALLPVYEVDSSAGVGTVVREGRRVAVNATTGAGLKPATYRWFAAEVVKAWMNSPHHRENITDPKLLYLGCSVQPMVTLLGLDNLFCVQVFFNPAE